MRIWRACHSERFNEATVQSILKWRRDVRLIEEKYHRAIAYSASEFACAALGDIVAARVHNATAPVLATLVDLERKFAALGRG